MQEAKKELNEWELSQKELEEALKDAENQVRIGDSSGAALMREHARKLERSSEKELAEVRAANATAGKELLEGVAALLKSAEAKLAACHLDDGEQSRSSRKAKRNAQKGVDEAKIQIEDAQAQVAMVTADLEFKEALSLVLQAKLASSEAKHAVGVGALDETPADAVAKAKEMRKRAHKEIADAIETLAKAAKEAVEAAEMRLEKETRRPSRQRRSSLGCRQPLHRPRLLSGRSSRRR